MSEKSRQLPDEIVQQSFPASTADVAELFLAHPASDQDLRVLQTEQVVRASQPEIARETVKREPEVPPAPDQTFGNSNVIVPSGILNGITSPSGHEQIARNGRLT